MKRIISIASAQLNKIAEQNINPQSTSQKFVQRSNFLAFFVMALVPIFIPIFFYVGAPMQAAALLGVFFNSYLIILLNQKFNNKSGRIAQMVSLLVWLFYFALIFGRASSAHYLYLAFTLIPFAQFHRSDFHIPLLSVTSFLVAFWAIEFSWVEIPTVIDAEEQRNLHIIVVTLVFLWVTVNFWYYNRTGEVYEEDEKLYLNYILSSAGRMHSQIKALMNHGRIGLKEEYVYDINMEELMANVQQDLSEAIAKSGAKITCANLPPTVNGYPMELHLLFQNLLSNALKFMAPERKPEVRIEGVELEHKWKFSFSDNGIGIDQMHQEKVFAIFQRLNPRHQFDGQGIGLAHCKKIVELHGGEIWFSSTPGKGTTFYFTLSKEKNELS